MGETKKKISYEELENVAKQLSTLNKQLYNKVQELSEFAIFKRLDYLFKVVEYKDAFLTDFVNTCVREIETVITLPENKEEDKKEEENE